MSNIMIKDLFFAYEGSDRLILKNIDMEVEAGEFVCLLRQIGLTRIRIL